MATESLKAYFKNFSTFPIEIKILALTTFINRVGAMVVIFLSKYMLEKLHFTYSQIGWVMVFFGVGSFVGTWISGKLIDKIGFYKTMILSILTSGMMLISLQFFTTFYSFCFGVLLLTTLADMYRPAMLVSLDTYVGKKDEIRALSLIRSASNIGFLFGPLIGGIIVTLIGYKFLFYIDGLTCIISILLFTYYVKEKKLPFKLKSFDHLDEKNSILNDKPFLIHLVVTMITGVLFFQIFTTLSLYYKEVFQFSSIQSGLFLALNGVLILFFELPIVQYVQTKKTEKLLVVSYGVLAMSLSYFVLLIEKNVFILILMMVLMTIGVMLTFPFANSFVKQRSTKKEKGKYMSIFTMSYSVAHILSTKTGMEIVSEYNYNTNWMLLGCIGLIGYILAFALLKIRRKEKRKVSEKIVKSIFYSEQ